MDPWNVSCCWFQTWWQTRPEAFPVLASASFQDLLDEASAGRKHASAGRKHECPDTHYHILSWTAASVCMYTVNNLILCGTGLPPTDPDLDAFLLSGNKSPLPTSTLTQPFMRATSRADPGQVWNTNSLGCHRYLWGVCNTGHLSSSCQNLLGWRRKSDSFISGAELGRVRRQGIFLARVHWHTS